MTAARPRVGLFVTCLVDLVRPQVGFAAAKLLDDAGFDVHVPETQTCCGQPAWNAGADAHARDIARNVVDVFEPFEFVVAPSGSCAGMIKRHYPEVFENDPVYLPKARALADRTHELMGFLAKFGSGTKAISAKCEAKVCYHDSCSSLREMGVKDEPRSLLGVVEGVSLSEMKEPQICCGFGGLFSVKYPEISERMAEDKIADVLASGADTLVAGDLGCLLHLAGRAERTGRKLRMRHAAEILANLGDEPALGEKPK